MRRALFHAARGLGRTTPNPLVGAVVVADGVVVGQGFHERAGQPHAEVHAINAAGARTVGATLYVTLEPCCHVGRTGPCTRRISEAGITRVVAAMRDPDPRVSGKGFQELRAHGITVDVGLCEGEAQRLNEAFITQRSLRRPLVILKAATSLDARVAARVGERTRITSPASQQKAQRLRATIDAIAVGSATMAIDDPQLTARDCYRERPLRRVIFDRRLRTRPDAAIFSTLAHGPITLVAADRTPQASGDNAERQLRDAGAEVIRVPDIATALEALARLDVMTLLVEGGPTLQRAFASAGLVDRLHLVIAPHAIGAGGVDWLDVQTLGIPPGAVVVAEPRGPDIWIEADVHRHR